MNNLLILSKDYQEYERLITQANLDNLSIRAIDDPQIAMEIGEKCSILFGEPLLISRVINNLKNVHWVQSSWAGVEALLVPGLRTNYLLTNARNVYGMMMSEYVFGYLLFIERQMLNRWDSQRKSRWDGTPPGSIKGKRIGLLGVGSIGSHLAQTAHHFGMAISGYTRNTQGCEYIDTYFHQGKILDFVADLDYLVCTLPGTNATKGLITFDVLSALPQSAWLINVGRGNTIVEGDLVDALNKHIITGAVLDVFNEEPLPEHHPLWKTPNTYITCHTAAKNYLPDIAMVFIENYRRLISNQSLLYQVDFIHQY